MKTLGAEDKDILPDFISYSAVMNVWARAGQAERAAAVLREMFIEFKSGNENVKPDLQCFNTVLAAYAKTKKENAPQQAENLLQDMKKIADDGLLEIHPDIFTVNSGTCAFISLFRYLEA
jgi:pentatricopeptide repeat protein